MIINFCDVLNMELLEKGIICKIIKKYNQLERYYIGSYFCSQYFLHMDFLEEFFSKYENGVKSTLVIPIFTEKDLKKGKEKIEEIFRFWGNCLDEVTVNDLGMLFYINQNHQNIKVNLGRLFWKNSRDQTNGECHEEEIYPTILPIIKDFGLSYCIKALELDKTNNKIYINAGVEQGCEIRYHSPFCYITTGNICKFASVHKAIEKKFRPNCSCNMECQNIYERYEERYGKNVELYRIGRAIYLFIQKVNINNAILDYQSIYFPFLELSHSFERNVFSL